MINFQEQLDMKAKFIYEALDFERENNPHKSLRIGKYKPQKLSFKDFDGEDITIEVIDDAFMLNDMEVKLEFKEVEGDIFAKAYIDGEESDMNIFHMAPSEYEFFVPKKPSVEMDGKYQDDPDPDHWSKTESAYGFPLVDKNDKEKLEEMQEKYGYWHVSSGDYTRTDKNPFVAVAKMILFTY